MKFLTIILALSLFVGQTPQLYANDETLHLEQSTEVTVAEELKQNFSELTNKWLGTFYKSKDFASTRKDIDMYQSLIDTTKIVQKELSHTHELPALLSLYDTYITMLKKYAETEQPATEQASDQENHTTQAHPVLAAHVTTENAQKLLVDSYDEFALTNATTLAKKTRKTTTLKRTMLRTLLLTAFHLSYARLSEQQDLDELDRAKKADQSFKKWRSVLSKQKPFLYLKLGKLAADWAVDETYPNQNATKEQRWAETLIPHALAYILAAIIVTAPPHNDRRKTYLKHSSFNAAMQEALQGLILGRFFINQKSKIYPLANATTYASFFQSLLMAWWKKPESLLRQLDVGLDVETATNILQGIGNLATAGALDSVDRLKWPAILNPKHRRRKFGKALGLAMRTVFQILFQ